MTTGARYEGKVALITGASSGMGRAISRRLAAEGADVIGIDVDGEGLDGTAKLVADEGGRFEGRIVDVSSWDACHEVVASVAASRGRLDVLGNVAGICWAEHATDAVEARYRKMMGVNIDGPFFLSIAAIPHLLESAGNIVNIASNAGIMGQAYLVNYTMTKGALVQMTRSLAMEYIKTDLRVNAICPGGTMTRLAEQFQAPDDLDMELMGRFMGYRGMAEADEIATMFAYVASDEAKGVHGAILSIDRGTTTG